MKIRPTIAAALAVALLAAAVGAVAVPADAQQRSTQADATTPATLAPPDPETGDGDRIPQLVDRIQERYDLTDDQADRLERLVESMTADGAARAEIKRAVTEQLGEWGVDPGEVRSDVARAKFHRLAERFELTDEQTAAAVDLVQEMRADGAAREEVRQAVKDRLVAWDVSPPTPHPIEWIGERFSLTDEQVNEVTRTVGEMRADGAARTEIRAAVTDQLNDYGVTDEELADAYVAYRVHCLAERFELTDDRAADLQALVAGLREDGATNAEVRDAVRDQLDEWGVRDGTAGPLGDRPGPDGHSHAPPASGGP